MGLNLQTIENVVEAQSVGREPSLVDSRSVKQAHDNHTHPQSMFTSSESLPTRLLRPALSFHSSEYRMHDERRDSHSTGATTIPEPLGIANNSGLKRPTYGKELCLLCLDGGGVRGLSTLHILKRLMESVNPNNPPKPCEYFDMIGGTSTGGLIALMLGRLGMPIDEAIEAYLDLSPKIFTKVHHRVTLKGQLQGRFDHTALETGVRELMDEKGFPVEDLLRNSSDEGCKTFVCATNKLTSETTILSSYPSRRRGSDLLNIATVWEAARATAAASSFFDPITIGGVDFVDGATPANNPIGEMWTEANDVFKEGDNWKLEDNILCLVSIGTGKPAIKSFGDDPIQLGKALLAIATDTEKRAEDFHRHHSCMAAESRYFRFNVLHGLESVGLEDASKTNQIVACTQKYLQTEAVFNAVEACGRKLIERENLQPIINMAQEIALKARAEFQSLQELKEVRDALEPSSSSLAWFTNTSKYQRWLLRNDEDPGYIWYPITDNSAFHRHENILPAVSHHLPQEYDAREHLVHVFYIRFPSVQEPEKAQSEEAESTFTTVRLENIFANLVSQVLVTYDDVRRSILSLSRYYRNLLRDLFQEKKNIGREDLVNILLACLRELALAVGAAKSHVKRLILVLVLENVQEVAQLTASNLLLKVVRLSRLTRLLVSSTNGDMQLADSWRDHKIDESTECTECLESLQFETMFARREQIAHAESGSNEWIWSYGPYVEWARELSGILWIQGKPGSGKSVLAKTISSRLTRTSGIHPWIIAHWFYNARGGRSNTSHTSMLRAILYQILDQDRRLFRYYQDAYRDPEWFFYKRLASIFSAIAKGGPDIPQIMCIIDAMDESSDEPVTEETDSLESPKSLEKILELLENSINTPGSSVKLLILSRPKRSIEKYLKYYHKVVLEYANIRDIEIIVDAGLKSLRRAIAVFDSSDEEGRSNPRGRGRRPKSQYTHDSLSMTTSRGKANSSRIFEKSREYEEEEISSIREYLLKKAQGVILWVTLIIQDLLRHVEKGMFTFQELKRLLKGLPLELNGLYCRITHDLQLSSSELDQMKARRILLWVIGASETRLLVLRELLDVLAITWDPDEALQSVKDPISSNRPQVRSWKHFRRSIYELCGPFIEVIRPASRSSDELFDDLEVEPTFVVQLTHQTAKDFLASSDAQTYQVTISEAKTIVHFDKIKYMKVALPLTQTSYMPKIEGTNTQLVKSVEELAQYFEQKLLLRYVLATLPRDISQAHIDQLRDDPTTVSHNTLHPFIAKRYLKHTDVVTSAENTIVGAYFSATIRAGLVTATQNMLFISCPAEWWGRCYRHIVNNAALLAAVEYGLFDEVRSLLQNHPDGARFLSANRLLLDRAAKTGIEETAMYIYDKAVSGLTSLPEGFPERESFLAEVQTSTRITGGIENDIEEVREAIRAALIR